MKAICLFSGAGFQEYGFERSPYGKDFEVVATSDISINAVLAYSTLHPCRWKAVGIPTKTEMVKYLSDINFGFDPMKNKKYDWNRVSDEYLEKCYAACIRSKNLGDISGIKELPNADLWFCSFPCTDISQSGKQKGFAEGSGTRSSLLFEQIRLLRKAIENGNAPKFIITENVKALISKKYIADWESVLDIFNQLGYNTKYSVLDAKEQGVPQSRPRVFMVAIRKDVDNGKFTFPSAMPLSLKLKDVLEENVDERYYLSEKIQSRLHITDPTMQKSIVGDTMPEFRTIGQRDSVYGKNGVMGSLMATDYKQPKQILEENGRVRKLTPREAGVLMGITYEEVDRMKAMGIADGKLYEIFGNGICAPCVQHIAEHLYKAFEDENYVCTDENVFTSVFIPTVEIQNIAQ